MMPTLTDPLVIRDPTIDAKYAPYSYIIFKDAAGKVYAKNGMTGQIDFSGTDAATVIQNALDATPEGGKVFIKTDGQYFNISKTLTINKNRITIEGDTSFDVPGGLQTAGNNSIIRVQNKLGFTLRNIGLVTAGSGYCLELIQSDKVKINDVMFRGAYGAAVGGGIHAEECWAVVVHGCFFYNLGGPGNAPLRFRRPASPRSTGWCSAWIISSCILETTKSSANIGPEYVVDAADPAGIPIVDSRFIGRFIESPRSFVQTALNLPGRGITIMGCEIIGSGQEAIIIGSESRIIGNKFLYSGSSTASQIKFVGGYSAVVGNYFSSIYGSPSIVHFASPASSTGVARTAIVGNAVYWENTQPKIFTSDVGGVPDCYGNTGVTPTRKSGTATIPAGQTSVTVAHGLAATPSKVLVTPRGNIGSVWVSARDATNITISCSTAPTTDTVVDWYAEV